MVKKLVVFFIFAIMFTTLIVQAIERKTPAENDAKVYAANGAAFTDDNLPGLKSGTIAPDFTLKSLNGKNKSLSQFKGKKVILNFWATWCSPCKMEMPELEKFYQKLPENTVILAINIDSTGDVESFSKKYGITFPILLDKNNAVNEKYGVLTIPMSYLIDGKGVIQKKHIGIMTYEDFQKFAK
ncbi:peroxiredoxin family protein [Falsibacillus albus]|uniref:TlpA family protein disulfide reductase n=1 Tax=Falsibacillus albus TaxID=2478915 RepID=A0A3L7JZ56_9BACI|nr:TlpA disulfide reductase family protein [Falsibacillus albus]RLQ96168.1 TlpA family protein disulfide reductase [Falsibacillus albus]